MIGLVGGKWNLKWLLLLPVVFVSGIADAKLVYDNSYKGEEQKVCDYVHRAFLNDQQINPLRIGIAYRDYWVEPRDVAAGRLLSAMKCGGWRFVFFSGTNAVGEANYMADAKSGRPVTCTDFGRFGTNGSAFEMIDRAEQLPQTKKRDYEVHSFGAGVFRGVWLHAKWDDIFIPSDNGFGKLEVFRPYSEKELIKILQPDEQKMLPIELESERQFHGNLSMYKAAMMGYERIRNGKRNAISPVLYETEEVISEVAEIVRLDGLSDEGHKVSYRIKVVYRDNRHFVVSRVEVLEKI